MKSLIIALTLVSAPLVADEFVINLKDPEFSKGVMKTEKGGVITASDLRVQAENITYINKTIDGQHIQKLIAEGDLMLIYQGRVFVGKKLVYNLLDKCGYLIEGKTNIEDWYVGGDRIDLASDGTFMIYGGFLTTCVSASNPWEIKTETATVYDDDLLKAKNVRFQVMKFPLLWLPKYQTNLSRFKDKPIRYRILWDKGLGPRLSMRYRFYANDTFRAFARFDYRITRGPGGALEAEYYSKDGLSMFQTRNYGALDKIFPNEQGSTRYRFQGLYKTRSQDEMTRFHVQWDKMSDDRMVSDFRDTDFEVNTQKATYLDFAHYKPQAFTEVTIHPKINRFQSLAQELPNSGFGLRPFEIFGSGIISENYASAAYLDYTFANQVDEFLKDRKAGRLETANSLYRPISFQGINITPRVGLVGIYYSNSPDRSAAGQLVYTYGGDANTRFSKQFDQIKHTIEPYAHYLGYSRPQTPVDDYFVFSIYDGYDRLDQLRFGVRQLFFSKSNSVFRPNFTLDTYTYAFWGAASFTDRFPKFFVDLRLNQSSWAFQSELAWNFQEQVLDDGNARFLWTVNESLALSVEFRYRSKFWWRKSNHENFVVDFARPLDELLISPLSDRRDTVLFKAHMRLSPRWNLNIYTFHGFGRSNEPNYNGAKVDFYTMLVGGWRMNLTYEYMPNDPFRLSYGFKLTK